jgi:hypothetical protein
VVWFANIGGLADEFNRREAYDVFNIQWFLFRMEKLMLNIRIVILSATLVVLLLLAIPLATARTEVISDPSGDSATVSNHPEESVDQNIAPVPSFRDPLDECFDVPIRDLAACRGAGQTPVQSNRPSLDQCFDVSNISERALCREASQVSAP